MKHECSIVRDLLPLYLEDLVSAETAAFVGAHLARCAACAAERDAMAAGAIAAGPDAAGGAQDAHASHALTKIRRRLRNRALLVIAITAALVAAGAVLLRFFPVYRMAQVQPLAYYSSEELGRLAYIGSAADRAAAQAVLRLADMALGDCTHTRVENEARYGLLARYATPSDRGASRTEHALELWSAHLEEAEGYLWVCYSVEAFDNEGNTVSGSREIPSLWKVERNDAGEWVVVAIKEHP